METTLLELAAQPIELEAPRLRVGLASAPLAGSLGLLALGPLRSERRSPRWLGRGVGSSTRKLARSHGPAGVILNKSREHFEGGVQADKSGIGHQEDANVTGLC